MIARAGERSRSPLALRHGARWDNNVRSLMGAPALPARSRALLRAPFALVAAVALAGCSPSIHNTVFQSYEVQLNGPNPTYVSASADPFARTKSYRVTVSYFEDADGKVPYGT